ncbi:MAG TPA: hypothetical protein VFG04_08970 [Planctomycetaceae bacterium]|jgi:hypothetical protein|nr:hypothetical protein [Planctomycetaceae bacterium]
MDENERLEKLLRQANEIYLEIGRFIVTYEHLMKWVRDGIYFSPARAVGSDDHVTEQAQTYARLAKCTPENVLDEFLELASKCAVATPEGMKLVRELVGATKALNEERNAAVHNTWMVGYASTEDPDFSTVSGFRHARKKGGVKFEATHKTAAEFASLTERAKELIRQCKAASVCASMGKPFEAHLKFDDEGKVVTHSGTFPA